MASTISAVALVERLITADQQSRRLPGFKNRPQKRNRFLGPELGATLGCYVQIAMLRRLEQAIGVLIGTLLDPVDPDQKCIAVCQERVARLERWADEIGDRVATDVHHLVTEPAHAACLLDPVRFGEPKVPVDIGADLVGIEMHCVEPRRQRLGQRGLAGARKTHH